MAAARSRPRLRVVEEQRINPIALCKTRSLGHDWAGGTTRWEEGKTRRSGRWAIYETLAITDCPRCQTQRREVFEQHGEDYVVKVGNRYTYTPDWRNFPPMTQIELQTARWRKQTAR